ncbi:MAG: NADH-quinone oxidoreductase subunit D [bacterium]|nr:NADH-quinone oxidoreductase subunit D [bacterium]
MTSLGTKRLEARRDPLLTEKIVFSVGPQHPSLVAPVQLTIQCDGELMEQITPNIGFMHRGVEYLAQRRPWDQLAPLLSRCEWIAGHNGDYLAAAAIEELAGIEVPQRALYLRTLVLELNRLVSHLYWFGDLGLELGTYTTIMWALRERETGVELLAQLSGNRYHHQWIVPGGVASEPPAGWLDSCAAYVRMVQPRIDSYEDFFSDNAIFVNRAELVGILDTEFALGSGASGPVLRACGVAHDLRKDAPYAAYSELGVRIPVGDYGDSLDRYRVRFLEMRESIRLVEECGGRLRAETGGTGVTAGVSLTGPHTGDDARAMHVPPGEAHIAIESPRGELALTVISDGGETPARVHLRGPSLYHIMLLPELCRGHLLADLFVIYASLDIMVGEVDR